MGILEERTRDFRLTVGLAKRKQVFLGWNGGFSKRKYVIFALMEDLQKENVIFA